MTPEQLEKKRERNRRYARLHSERRKLASRTWYHANKDHAKKMQRNSMLVRRYGLTATEWDALFAKQNHSCAVCKTTQPGKLKGWQVDHCHQTGHVRGILCLKCNVGVGLMGDDPLRLRLAADYLERT